MSRIQTSIRLYAESIKKCKEVSTGNFYAGRWQTFLNDFLKVALEDKEIRKQIINKMKAGL